MHSFHRLFRPSHGTDTKNDGVSSSGSVYHVNHWGLHCILTLCLASISYRSQPEMSALPRLNITILDMSSSSICSSARLEQPGSESHSMEELKKQAQRSNSAHEVSDFLVVVCMGQCQAVALMIEVFHQPPGCIRHCVLPHLAHLASHTQILLGAMNLSETIHRRHPILTQY